MKRLLPLTLIVCCSASLAYSQDRFAYAITDVVKDGVNWSSLRKVDLQTGAFGDIVLNGTDANSLSFDAATKKQMTEPLKDARFGNLVNAAFGTGVAAIAYDKKNQRLYYTPMLMDQLRYIDLKTMKVYFVNNSALTGSSEKAADQSNIVTRMAIASDGNGYALTNDGNHLIRFTTGKATVVTDLGVVTDAPANVNVSIHNSCTSYGGDMIADDDGNLFVFSARNHIFRINIETKVATHLSGITGLPANFTANGVAVTPDNHVLVSSAIDNSALYSVDMNYFLATKVSDGAWKTSDLANSNLLSTRKPVIVPELMTSLAEVPNKQVQLFPNPVIGKEFAIRFSLPDGNYTLRMTDIVGRQTLLQSMINLKGAQTENVQLPASTQKGMYLVRVLDHTGKTVYNKKVLVQ
jgi:hypothetical protein